MSGKNAIIRQLEDEYRLWLGMLEPMSTEQAEEVQFEALSLKDKIAHLWAWQQRTIEKLQAAMEDREPEFPEWPAGLDPDREEDLEPVNSWIYDSLKDKSWDEVLTDWENGFQIVIDLAGQIPEDALLEKGRFAWLGDGRLYDVLYGTYDHHHVEHLPDMKRWMPGE